MSKTPQKTDYTILSIWDKKEKKWSFEVAINGSSKRVPFSTFAGATLWITNHNAENGQRPSGDSVDGVYISKWLNYLEDEISCLESIRHRLEARVDAANLLQQEALAQEYRNLAAGIFSAVSEINKLSDDLEDKYTK